MGTTHTEGEDDEKIAAMKAANVARAKKWKADNPDKVREHKRNWRKSHPDAQAAIKRRVRLKNPDAVKEQKRLYRKRHPQRVQEQKARCKAAKPEMYAEMQKRYRQRHPEVMKAKKERRISRNPLAHAIGKALREVIRKRAGAKRGTAASYLGCSWDALKAHLEAQFQPGMSWSNRSLTGWHIDHIVPVASFDHTVDAEVRACWHYTNLRPLWGKENQSKGARVCPAIVGAYRAVWGLPAAHGAQA